MKRRDFIKNAAAAGIPLFLNGMPLQALARSSFFKTLNEDSDRVLVLIQLNGGNDGLNTLIPIDQYDPLANVRSNIILPEGSWLPLTDTIGLHPSMTGLRALYDNARLGIIQGVGYPNQNRSHFRSTDIWTSASPADEFWRTGWLGRHFEGDHPNFPDGYPNETFPAPFAITMGSIVSETCQGTAANFSMTLNDPFSLSPLSEGIGDDLPATPYGEELGFLRDTIVQTNAYSEAILAAAESGNNGVDYPADNRLAQQLKNVALLIAGGLSTKVYVVSLGGFDTHANQVVGGDPTTGEHALLLQILSGAVSAFQADLQQLGLEERVIGMTFSEFGRRIRSNDSFGTDHGTAAPLIVFGACVTPQILGENPEIATDVDVQEGVPMQYDFRDIYGSVLMDWFEVEEAEVANLLHPGFQYLPIIQPCGTTATRPEAGTTEAIETYNYPNPFRQSTTIVFHSNGERIRLSLFDSWGQELRVVLDRTLPAGEHQVPVDTTGLPAGSYFYHLRIGQQHGTRRMVKN